MIGSKIKAFVLTAGMVTGLFACTTLNNPFWPAAEVSILEIKGTTDNKLIGIEQALGSGASASGRVIEYTYNEPVVSLRNPANLPAVNFNKFRVSYRLADGATLPAKEYPLFQSLRPAAIAGGGAQAALDTTVDVQFQVLSADTDLLAVVFPGNSAPRVEDGIADITLFGKDDHGYSVELDFTVPLTFSSLAFASGNIPAPDPEATPTPEGSQDLNDLTRGLNQNT